MEERQEKKVSTVVAILWILFLLLVDTIDFFLTLIGVGLITNSLINIPIAGFIQFWLYKEGIKGMASLAGSLIEFIPVINMLPVRTATMMATIYIANNPKLAQAAGMVKGKLGSTNKTIARTEGPAATGRAPHPQTPMQLQPAPITIKPIAQ